MLQGNEDIEGKLPEKMNAVSKHLSPVFHRYLSGEGDLRKLSIRMNNQPVEPSDPFLLNRNTQAQDETLITIDERQIKIVPYVLPYPSKLRKADTKLLGLTADLQKNQGLYIYRNKRLIVWGKWFRRSKREKFSQLARIQIDIPSDFDNLWVLDVKKSVAVPPDIICKSLDAMIGNISELSKRKWVWRGRKETDKKIFPVWNRRKTRDNGVLYEVNAEHPIFRRLIEKFPAGEKDLRNMLKLIAAELPLNSLVVDLNGDENKIENPGLYTADNVREILKIFTDGLSGAETNRLLDTLLQDEPYKNFPQVIDEFRKD